MVKTKKILSALLFVFSFSLIIVDNSYIKDSHNYCITSDTLPDVSDHFEHSHGFGQEVYLTMNDITKTCCIVLHENSFPSSDLHFRNNYISNIWQPPKIS
jgi:hypothetical protein